MDQIIRSDDVPGNLLSIPELDFSQDLLADRTAGLWFRLGAWTITPSRDERGIQDVISRQSFLLTPGQFSEIFDNLDYIGNHIGNLGKPKGSINHQGATKTYDYSPFHRFEFHFNSVTVEPLVFVRSITTGVELFINPDLELYFELEEKTTGSGIWWDPRRGVEALRRHVVEEGNLAVVDIRTDYLSRYLQARQMALVVGHYRHLHLYDPSPSNLEAFVAGDMVLGSPDQRTKAILHNNGPHESILGTPSFLRRSLHLWFEIEPPEVDVDDPWAEEPPFDPYNFTLPTRVGPVAPARWTHFRQTKGRTFEGATCDFMDDVCFRQEVLTKYEGTSGFDVSDNGSVSCRHYWGLIRSTSRIGNELLATHIGDFAEGVPFEEWPHWKQYVVEPPSLGTLAALREEKTIPDAVNSVERMLKKLNVAFTHFADSIGVGDPETLWQGSLDSLAGRQLKWVYPTDADDDEFLKRATLASTLVIDALAPASLRKLLSAVGKDLHLNDGSPSQPLGSRNLLQRVTLVAVLVQDFQPPIDGIPKLVMQVESITSSATEADLQAELVRSYQRVRDEFAPLAFLYDLRTHGGLAHTPNMEAVAAAATKLGLPGKNWNRTDYLRLLSLVAGSIMQINQHLETAAQQLESRHL